MPNSKARQRRLRDQATAEARAKYGPDWQPARCNFCAGSARGETIRKGAVTFPADAEHGERTVFLRVGVRPKHDGEVVATGRKVRWYGDDDKRVPEFRPVRDDDPPHAELTRFRIHSAKACLGDDE